jgi:hypothetical protein
MLTVGPLRGTEHEVDQIAHYWDPWEIQECPPSTQKTLMAGPMGGGVGDPREPTINTKIINSGPLGGGAEYPGAPSINARNVNDGPPVRQCRRSWSAHHQH